MVTRDLDLRVEVKVYPQTMRIGGLGRLAFVHADRSAEAGRRIIAGPSTPHRRLEV
jgi:hypothetical protein